MIFLLLVLLIILLIASFRFFGKDLVSPAVLFISGFVYCVVWACVFLSEWNLDNMRADTFWVLLSGAIIFILSSIVVHLLFKKYNLNKLKNKSKKSLSKSDENGIETGVPKLNIPVWFKIISFIFMIVALFVSLDSVINVTSGDWSDVLGAISKYDNLTKFNEGVISTPAVVTLFRMVANALIYWFVYIFVAGLLTRSGKWWKRIDYLSLANIIIGAAIFLSTGGRNGLINILVAAIVIFVILFSKKHKRNVKVKLKWFLPALIIFAGLLVLFPKVNALVGRKVSDDTSYYLAIYSGAEVKNLDIFLDNYENGNFVSSGENQTFINVINPFRGIFHTGEKYKLDIPFQKTVGADGEVRSLGNVYTTYYQFIYDFGYFGVVWCTALAAAISQFVYEKCRRSKVKGGPLDIYVLIYGYISSSLVLSFFSNKFFEQNFNKNFLFNVIFWIILIYIFSNKKKTIFSKSKNQLERGGKK